MKRNMMLLQHHTLSQLSPDQFNATEITNKCILSSHLFDFVHVGTLVPPILSRPIGSINDNAVHAQFRKVIASFGQRRRGQLDDDPLGLGASDRQAEIGLGRAAVGAGRGTQGEHLVVDGIETFDVAVVPSALQMPSSPSLPVFLQPTVTSSTLGPCGQ